MDIDTVCESAQDMIGMKMRFRVSGYRYQDAIILSCLFCMLSIHTGADSTAWSLLPARSDDTPGFVYHPSPDDWRNHTIYQIITDRFYDGDPSNNTANPGGVYNPLSMDSIHGGDFAGITTHLDYIKDLGFDTIWISPVFLNHRGAYHGYHIMDFNKIDPHWGTLEELREMIDQAHTRGMYVIIDVVFNHMARILRSEDPGFPRFSEKPYTMQWSNPNTKFAPPFDDLSYFHAHGSINDWEDYQQNILGDLQGLADLRTEDPQIRRWLLESHLALIAATDCDGFRIDTTHHVELDFWQEVMPQISAYAATLGKTNFLMFGEALRGRDEDVSIFSREGGYPSMLYYPYYFTLKDVWGSRHPTRLITERWEKRHTYGKHAMDHLVAFADNHDRERLLNSAYLDGDTNRLAAILTMLFASPAIPCVYYGTEQGFSGSKGHRAREPMFDPTKPGMPDHFDPDHDVAAHIRELNHVRRLYPALMFGDVEVLQDSRHAGVFAFRRHWENQSVTIVANNSTEIKKYDTDDQLIDAIRGEPFDGRIPGDSTIILVNEADFIPLEINRTHSRGEKNRTADSDHYFMFKSDGYADEQATLVASNSHSRLLAAFDRTTRMVYLAASPARQGYDRFILVAYSNHTTRVDAPWQKQGHVPRYDVLISDEGDSDYTSIRGINDGIYWSNAKPDGVLEAVFQIPLHVDRIHIWTAEYGTEDRGALNEKSILPAGARNTPWLAIPLEAITIR